MPFVSIAEIERQQEIAAAWCIRHAVADWFLTYRGKDHLPCGICAYIDDERMWAAFIVYANAHCPDISVERMSRGIYNAHQIMLSAA